MLIKENYAAAEFKDVVRYKIKWLFNILYQIYNKYIELYDFSDDLF